MLNRRHLRIKILQAIYAFTQSDDGNLSRGEKELMFSISKMYEMYIYLLLICDELLASAEGIIADGKKKRLPSEEDLNPNTKFIDNKLLHLLRENRMLNRKADTLKLGWTTEREMVKKLFKDLRKTEEYQAYMANPERSFAEDREVVIRLFKRHIINHEPLQFFFEERSIFWIDDLDLAASMAIKTLKSFSEDSDSGQELLPLYKDEEDELDFVKTLFRKSIVQSDENMGMIKEHTQNWEIERIAMMDIILMKMALTEVREFSHIPVKVTLNEYIEISKFYSTPKSNGFINGILDKLFTELKDAGKIKKVGRGLIN